MLRRARAVDCRPVFRAKEQQIKSHQDHRLQDQRRRDVEPQGMFIAGLESHARDVETEACQGNSPDPVDHRIGEAQWVPEER